MEDDMVDFYVGMIAGAILMLLIVGLLWPVVINSTRVSNDLLDAVCKDKLSNSIFSYINGDGNIVCISLPIMNMTRLDSTNKYVILKKSESE